MIKKAVTVQISEKQDREQTIAALLVQAASRYHSAIYMKNGRYNVNAKSIMGMMTLGLPAGEEITVIADGADEEKAIEHINKYLSNEK